MFIDSFLKNQLVLLLFELSLSALQFPKLLLHNVNGCLPGALLDFKFFDPIVHCVVLFLCPVFKKKHIFGDQIIKLIIKLLYHAPHPLIHLVDVKRLHFHHLLLGIGEAFLHNIVMSVGYVT